ncbi:Signal transduction histidine kinase [Prevotella aff. ruminicola Tc2-24]|uniref:histidine kinase n=2 Tax=Prevotella aff. ruminicola Tc2-24 TaxID=81582 RepID=A0A1I0PLS9_9BACT|nr:Signal transduction histidine kinase [Prevotella aff. ruminicola Tc2-24]
MLLMVSWEDMYLYPLVWVVGILLFIALVIAVFVQLRTGKKIRSELAELEKVRQGNIEYEFILRAMKLCTWHIDAASRTLTIESDFREGQDNYVPAPDTPVEIIMAMVGRADRQRVRVALDDLCTGRSTSYHEQYQVKTSIAGLTYWEESYGTVVERDEEGNPSRILGATMRIDRRKQLEEALISARNKAEESDRLKTAFLANMGHEIRTPLNAIVGFADVLPMVDNAEDRNHLIREIQNNNQKLLRVIDGLVSMSKVEAEGQSLVRSQTELNALLRRIADHTAPVVDRTAVVVATEFPYAELMLTTDVSKLTEIINHFMQNAVKFTESGSITLGYELQDGEHVRIWVRDTGKGIPEEDKDRIFERFVKLDEYVPGTGLGLAMARTYAKSLGGTIGVETRLGHGSTFWVRLPLM